ncbi:MAG: S8 family serine peptidase [Phycisphaerae bacterium]|nr:S8 family serine peptidase [Phycisphaerae bacterium]
MKEQIQERPSAWRLLISSMLIVCAQVSLAAAGELSLSSLSDTIGLQGTSSDGGGALLVRFVDSDTAPQTCPDLLGPRTQRARRAAIANAVVEGADVATQYDEVVPGLSLVTLPQGISPAEAALRFTACADVLYAEPNYKYQLDRTPNDAMFAQQWALNNTGQSGGLLDADIDATEAWNTTTGSKDVIVAVLDTGIDPTNADVALNLWQNSKETKGTSGTDDDGNGYIDDFSGYNFIGDNTDLTDEVYHGTYVAGIIGAYGNNQIGIAGVCWNVGLMICKVADADGVNLDAAVAAVQYATASGAKVINASWSGPAYSKSLRDAIEAAGEKGILFVASAGNGSANTDNVGAQVYPAGYDLYNIISVMATNSRDQMAATTNCGLHSVDIAEPGEEILSTMPMTATDVMTEIGLAPEYGTLSGTSVAAPHVSGVCALMRSKSGALTYHQIKQILMQTSDKVVPGLCQSHGRVNAANALAMIPTGTLGRVLNTRDDPNDTASFYTSLQEAIDDANDGDTLIAEGGTTGTKLFLERIDFKGKAITVRSGNLANPSDPTLYPDTTVILGLATEGSVVTFAHGEGRDTVLKGFTVAWGVADYGGGISCVDASPTISDCIIRNNHARLYGGGMDCLGGSPEIVDCVIHDNVAYDATAFGGGLNFQDAEPTITSCTIRNNSSQGAGGGIAFANSSGTIFNSFLLNNSAVGGSGQIDLDASSPTITNCTILVEDGTPARDGGICAFSGSSPTITNCILWGNGDDLFGCWATYSCIEDEDGGAGNIHAQPNFTQGPNGVYFLSQTAAGQTLGSPCVDAGDPNTGTSVAAMTTRTDGVADSGAPDLGAHYTAFAASYYPLTVTVIDANGAPVDANDAWGTVDPNAGSYRLFEVVQVTAKVRDGYRIKRWVGTPDDTQKDSALTFTVSGPINLQVEFEPVPLYRLVTRVAGRWKVEGSDESCAISPDHSRGVYYREGQVVTVTAIPVGTYIIDRWTGTDNDASWALTNAVTMTSDKEVTVSFTQPRTLMVPGQYPNIQSAVDAARTHGDSVVVKSGTYYIKRPINFGGRAITLSSSNPDDPACVAATVIDCDDPNVTDPDLLGECRAFTFDSGEGTDSVIDGFTIRNGNGHDAGGDPYTSPGTATNGTTAYGGAIACFNGSSPTLSNLIIQNCKAYGQLGGAARTTADAPDAAAATADAEEALEQDPDPDPRDPNSTDPNAPADPNAGMPGANGANGNDGAAGQDGQAGEPGLDGGTAGSAYGGAFYFDANSAPIILSCTITDCCAVGGDGGVGGQGQDGQDGQTGQAGQDGQQGQNGGEPAEGTDGAQGAGGNGGNGGAGGNGGKGGDGGNGGKGGDGGEALGGAIYFGPNCRPTIKYTTILGCLIRQGVGADGGSAGAGGAGGDAGAGGLGADGGDGEPAGAAGADGAAGTGGNGGNGGNGGAMGSNGARCLGGGIYFGENCQAEISDTVVSGSFTDVDAATEVYPGGAGGNGGAGGSDGGNGGNGGNGGDGNAAGALGTGGSGGAGGGAGGNGVPGLTVSYPVPLANYGGGIYYGEGCSVVLTRCTISNNTVHEDNGGGEYYSDNCTTVLTNCTISGNIAGTEPEDPNFILDGYAHGGGQAFGVGCSATIVGCTYSGNVAEGDGGGLYVWYECDIDINDSTFTGNDANTPQDSAGGGIYAGGVLDIDTWTYYNGGTIRVQNSTFTDNAAAFGAGMYWYGNDADVLVADSAFRTNTAEHGGGLYWNRGAPTISGCVIRGNTATGATSTVLTEDVDENDPNVVNLVVSNTEADCGTGGGLHCLDSDALIQNCYLSENISNGTGGGAYFASGRPIVNNCLVNGNTAAIGGGGIASQWDAAPTISNCTIVENGASDSSNGLTRGYGGGLFCSYESQTILMNSILWGNTGRYGSQIAIGSKDDPTYLQYPAGLTVKYCDIQGGQPGVHIEGGRTLNWLAGNLSSDPLFVAPYFLSQAAAGQPQTSPAVDAGSALASQLGLDSASTRSDNVADAGPVDLGYHYIGQGQYQLTVTIIGGHGTVQPLGGRYHELQTVTLTAIPDPNYRVRVWTGTDDDPAWDDNTNTVTFSGSDIAVTVEFEPDLINELLVPANYATIEDAVAAAGQGGTKIVLAEGTHTVSSPDGIDFEGKTIVITSLDPNDPSVVASTIIDAAGDSFSPRRAFHFHSGEDPNCIITGVTITNGYVRGERGADGRFGVIQPNPYDGLPIDLYDPLRPRAERGADGTGDSYGGAVLCENGSSPLFRNCVITGCISTGGHGGTGAEGQTTTPQPDYPTDWTYLPPATAEDPDPTEQTTGDGQWGGYGGTGTGIGHGGALACLDGSNPLLINCVFSNNTAYGGMGGDGGDGGNGSGDESWGGDAGHAIGDGRGGAIYCGTGSAPVIRNCQFLNNFARTGVPGLGGARGSGNTLDAPYGPADDGSDGLTITYGVATGGAIFYDSQSSADIVDSNFVTNQAFTAVLATVAGGVYSEIQTDTKGGAIYAVSGCAIDLDGCQFLNHNGGALYMVARSAADVNDCLFTGNARKDRSLTDYIGYTPTSSLLTMSQGASADVSTTFEGGAIYMGVGSSHFNVTNSQFFGNVTDDRGGAVRTRSNATVKNCLFGSNEAANIGGGFDAYYENGYPAASAILTVNFERCLFTGNRAYKNTEGWGGGVYLKDVNAVFNDCSFVNNRARNGAGLTASGGVVTLARAVVHGNTAIGSSTGGDVGGGLLFAETPATITDSRFSNNVVQGVDAAGGAICFYGGFIEHVVKNCLFTGNSSNAYGGAVSCTAYATPKISFCTFVENTARTLGGAIYTDWMSDVSVNNSIFQANDHRSIGSVDSDEDNRIACCLFHNNPDGDYGLYDSATGQTSQAAGDSLGTTNLTGDPLFVAGPLGDYYLSQVSAGQTADSAALDQSNLLASDSGMDQYTTRTDNGLDSGNADLGYHYRDATGLPHYTLTASVGDGNGTVAPTSGTYYAGTLVVLTATPVANYTLAQWTGTDDDASTLMENPVMMWSDRTVVVTFAKARIIRVDDSAYRGSIQRAIEDANNGDTVVVPTGTYSPHYIGNLSAPIVIEKAITLTSENPDDPDCVAATVIDHVQFMVATTDGEATIEGFTITNRDVSAMQILSCSPTLRNCVFTNCRIPRTDNPNNTIPADDGPDGDPAYGGAIDIEGGSPTVVGCTFSGCSVTGGRAGDGDGNANGQGHDGGWPGYAYGGAVYCASGSPTFTNCRFVDCYAQGGIGGKGGNGNPANNPPGRGGGFIGSDAEEEEYALETGWNGEWLYGPYMDYWKYSGYGGAVYCEYGSSIRFVNCTFENNYVLSGLSGIGGDSFVPELSRMPEQPVDIECFGGALYAGYNSSYELVNCTFSGCWAEREFDPNGVPGGPAITGTEVLYPDDPYLGYGGAVAIEESSSITMMNCTIVDCNATIGGAIYAADSELGLADCNLATNTAYHGGAVYLAEGTGTIDGSTFFRNVADYEPNDVYRIFDANLYQVGTMFSNGGAYFGVTSPVQILNSTFRENEASASGGGLYFTGAAEPLLQNSLVTRNKAGRDGGGVSAKWYADPTISNCTFTENKVTGALGDDPGYGGGLYVSYNSSATVINSILWGNFGVDGAQLAIGSGNDDGVYASGVTMSYSDIGPAFDPNDMIDPLATVAKSGVQAETSVGATAGGDVLIDSATIDAELASKGSAAVIVTLHEPDGRDAVDWNSREAVVQFQARLANRRATVLNAFQPGEFTARQTYANVASFSGQVTKAGLDRLKTNPSVRHIEPVRYAKLAMRQALALGNAREIRHTYNGRGISIAIVDSGVDYTHPMLGGTGNAATSTFPNEKVIGGYDTAENDPDPMPVVVAHGTCCAGIAAGELASVEDYIGGVAYGARIYALKIGADDGNIPTDAALGAWDWCITHRNDDPEHPIKVMSNSWGLSVAFDDANVADAYSPSMAVLADTAVSVGITIVAASGNEFFTTGIGWPAAMSNVISVGALYDVSGLVTDYSNAAENLDVLAPADPVYTPDMVGAAGYDAGDYFPSFAGTSSATPFVAGCVASIQQAALERLGRYLTPAEVEELIETTGDLVTDTKVAITKPRVNLGAALTLPSGPPIYIGADCELNGWLAAETATYPTWDSTLWGADAGVIVADPCFISGYYLSQTAAGQDSQSPAVDAGSDSAQTIGLADRTTRIDGVFDANRVDLGYHYAEAVPVYQLTVTVVADSSGQTHGAVQPGSGSYLEGTELALKAVPETGYYLQGWYDANDTLLSLRPEYNVVVDANRVLRVRFRLPEEIVVGSEKATGIQEAVDSAANGDTIIISAGVYSGSINLRGKQIRLTSTNPDDPAVVAQTVIDCGASGRALIFNSGEGPDTIITGITIMNGATLQEPGAAVYIGAGCSPTFINVMISNSAVSFSSGGAVYIGANANPTFTNVQIDNCHAWNAIVVDTGQPFGAGSAGAVYIHTGSRPTFTNCSFTNCTALGYGGAIYCGPDGLATFTNCRFTANDANDRGGAVYHVSGAASKFVQCTFSENATDLLGGAVFYGRECTIEVSDCNFTENLADESGGALYLSDQCAGSIGRSVFTHNDVNEAGGAIYMTGSSIEIADCNVAYNSAHRGGGLYCYDTPDSKILRCSIKHNEVLGVQRQFFLPIDGTSAPISPTDPNFVYDVNAVVIENVRGGTAAAQGGGVYAYAGPALISDCQISHNAAATSGGGLYLTAGRSDLRTLFNCLVTDNSAGRDGAGISCSWQVNARIANCTIGNNSVKSLAGEALGAGVYAGYGSNVVVTNSIVWDNVSSDNGSQLAVTGETSSPSAMQVTYSDVEPSPDPSASAVGLDMVFVIDSTDTMIPSMRYVREAAAKIANAIDANVADCRMAVVDFRDFNDTDRAGGVATDYPYRVVTPFTEDVDTVVSAINSVTAVAGAGGPELAESVYYALTQTADANDLDEWRTGRVARVVLLIGDGVPHNPELVVGYRLSDVVEALSRESSKRVHTLQIGEANDVQAYYEALANLTDGVAVQATDANDMTVETAAVVAGILPLTRAGSSIYVADGSTLSGWNAGTQTWDPNLGNIDADPYFLAGYYLDQTAAGQSRQSPAIDAGSGSVDPNSSLGARTTRADGVADSGTVDMGYHYAQGVTLYTLTAQVLPDAADGLVHGIVTPAISVVYEGSTDNVIRLEVKAEDGWRVKAWTGTDDDTLTSLVNYVTLTSDRQVTVTLQQRTARVVTVPGDYTTIQGAVTASEDGDTILVDPGTYYSGYGDVGLIMSKEITVTSRNPDDPCAVASTVISGPGGIGGNTWSRLGVVFTGSAGRRTVLNGFTIENFGGIADNGDDGDRAGGHPNGEDGVPIQGAAMILLPGASPTIKNCVIRNNSITGGDGGNGVAATTSQNAGRGGWGGWARGGAIYCASNTNPLFVNCTIENNSAQAGSGGNGGAGVDSGGLANYGGNYTPSLPIDIDPDRLGATAVAKDLWRIWEWDYATYIQMVFASESVSLSVSNVPLGGGSYIGDYRWYSAYGGGVFIDAASKAEFVECTLRGNSTVGGMTGQGGAQPPTGRLTEPLTAFEVPSYGGAVYCAADTVVAFRGCNFENNTASADSGNFRSDPYVGFGGGVAAEYSASVSFEDCNFVDNEADTGGAVYLADAVASLMDTILATNTAIRGAGVAGVGGEIGIAGCEVRNNIAIVNAGDVAGDGVVAAGAGIFFSSASGTIQDCNIAGNSADGSGGGIYLRGEDSTSIVNCLIRGNLATRDGGGISTNWYATPMIRNCTFYANQSIDPNNDQVGLGGGLFCGYFSDANVVDCIFWENGGRLGTELAVGTGFDLDPHCGTLRVSYSDIFAGPNDVYVDVGCTLVYGEGILRKDPKFVEGPLDNFYLSNKSPCVDAGSSLASVVGMSRYSTRTDSEPDTGVVDMGYHHAILEPCKFCDLVYDGEITFEDFAKFASQWLSTGCSASDGWCNGADFTFDSAVDAFDLAFFADCWLVKDETAPLPNPSAWAVEPYMADDSAARMVAVEAVDSWGWDVEYYFDCVYGDGHDSGWITSRSYVDSGLAKGVEYGYRVKARDLSPWRNETEWSEIKIAGTADRVAPTPEPYIQSISAVAGSYTSITMAARIAYDDNGVQYYFDANEADGGHDSGWIDSQVYTDVNLPPETTHCYRVRARDLSAANNQTEWSGWICATTNVAPESDPPTPSPMQFDPNEMPHEVYGGLGNWDYYAEMTAVTATDPSGGVQYYFLCEEPYDDEYPAGFSSGWQDDPTWSVPVGGKNRSLRFKVKARDVYGNETEYSDWAKMTIIGQ